MNFSLDINMRYRDYLKFRHCCHNALILTLMIFGLNSNIAAQVETILAGSVVIDMGVVPQTADNAMEPYGLLFRLIKEQKVPVKWAINSSKAKDGVDFTAKVIPFNTSAGFNIRNFSGGPFIISDEFIQSPSVQTLLINWKAEGVVMYTLHEDTNIEIYKDISELPNWVMDDTNGDLAIGYLNRAKIPATAYRKVFPSILLCKLNTSLLITNDLKI